MTRNPYAVGLLSAAGICVVVAYMLSLVIAELTDYASYDVAAVTGVQGWMFVLLGVAGAAGVGAAVIGGIAWSRRRDAPASPDDGSAAPDEASAGPAAVVERR